MAGDEIDPSQLEVRVARPEDYEDVLTINPWLYQGLDYLHHQYMIFIHHPHIYPYLARWKGKVVGFMVLWVVDDGKAVHSMAGRTHPDYKKQGIMRAISQTALAEVVARYPQLQRIVWATFSNGKNEEFVTRKWHLLTYIVTREDILKAVDKLTTYDYEKDVFHLSPQESIKMLSDDVTRKALFRENTFAVGHCWLPLTSNKENMKYVSRDHTLLATKGTGERGTPKLSGLSYQNLLLGSRNFGIRGNIYFQIYDTRTLLGHLVGHLKHFARMMGAGKKLGFYIHFPLEIDLQRVQDFLDSGGLGMPIESPVFHTKYYTLKGAALSSKL